MKSFVCIPHEQFGLCLKSENWSFRGRKQLIPGHLLLKESGQSHLICSTFHQNCSFIALGHYQLFWVNGIPHFFQPTYYPKRQIPLLFWFIFNGFFFFLWLDILWCRPASLRDSSLNFHKHSSEASKLQSFLPWVFANINELSLTVASIC